MYEKGLYELLDPGSNLGKKQGALFWFKGAYKETYTPQQKRNQGLLSVLDLGRGG